MPGQQAQPTTDIQASGERVVLRPLGPEELAKVESLCGQAAPASEGHRLAITLRDEPIGFIDYRLGYPEPGWLTIDYVGVAPTLRARGYGSEAVRLLEEETLRLGLATRFRAEVDPSNGLCVYFWLRLGYRPIAAEDTIAMIRLA